MRYTIAIVSLVTLWGTGSVHAADAQAVVTADLGVTSISQLDGASICMTDDPATNDRIETFFKGNNFEYLRILVKGDGIFEALEKGRCDALFATKMKIEKVLGNPVDKTKSGLSLYMGKQGQKFALLPEKI